jgi:hypothetical protein
MAMEARQPRIPFGTDVGHPIQRGRERLRCELVARFAPLAPRLDEPGLAQRGEVFRHSLPRDL